MRRLSSIVIALGILAGCSSGSQNVKKDFVFQKEAQTGLLVVATRLKPNKKCIKAADTLVMRYSGSDSGKEHTSGMLNIKNFLIAKDFKDPGGYFYVQALKKGRYRIHMIQYLAAGSYPPAYLTGYEFVIRPNQVNYLGEIVISIDDCGGDIGATKATLTFRNKVKRDTALFHERVPNVKPKLVYQKVGAGR